MNLNLEQIAQKVELTIVKNLLGYDFAILLPLGQLNIGGLIILSSPKIIVNKLNAIGSTEPFSGTDAHPKVGHGQATVFGLGRQSKSACKFSGGQCESNPKPYLQPQAVYHQTNSS
ncbi:hypothetical protein YC2023_028571 [Brassica napus]